MPSALPARKCPHCGAPKLHYGGIGTERLEREIQLAFPDVAARRMDSDTMRGSGSHERVLKAFQSGEVKILLGTQMIAKGLDFPNVTLVGVVNADTALHLPDFRAAEKTFQLRGAGGRAHRTRRQAGPRAGADVLHPTTPRSGWLRNTTSWDLRQVSCPCARNMAFRRLAGWCALSPGAPNEALVQSYMNDLANGFRAAADSSVRILGPAAAPVLKIRNLYRFHLQLRCPNSKPLQVLASSLPRRHPPPEGVDVAVDVDPISML